MAGLAWSRRRLAAPLAATCAIALAAGCTSGGASRGTDRPSRSAPTAPTRSVDPCPARYAEPDPERARITLRFSIDAGRRTVTGSETVVFTPDLPVTELVFRLWPNGPTAPRGTRLTVTSAESDGATKFHTEAAGAAPGTPGTLLRLPLGRTAPVGAALTANLRFALTLGGAEFERWGSTGRTAWWGTGFPLLAWVRGAGWQRQPAGPVGGEYAVSETARYDVTVEAPAGDTVLITGIADAPTPAGPGRRRRHAVNLTARDVSVTVGVFTVRTGEVDGVPIEAAVSADTAASPDVLLAETVHGLRGLVDLLGPYPFPSLTVIAVPPLSSGGIEYPGGFWVGPKITRRTVTHEAAHQWFYGMVGDNQAVDPWLDEAFATYSEAVVNDRSRPDPGLLSLAGRVGAPVNSFAASPRTYFAVVYGKGAAALLTARQQAEPPPFDAAIRCYVHANAWRVAAPADLDRALARMPAARATLRKAGALP